MRKLFLALIVLVWLVPNSYAWDSWDSKKTGPGMSKGPGTESMYQEQLRRNQQNQEFRRLEQQQRWNEMQRQQDQQRQEQKNKENDW